MKNLSYKLKVLLPATLLSLILTSNLDKFAFALSNHDKSLPSCEIRSDYKLGSHSFPISSKNPKVQELFNQGINWIYSFNHGAAEQMFRKALELEANCAMCYWGIAYVRGPNINAPMDDLSVPNAYEAIQKALSLLNYADDREKGYILALSQRYSAQVLADRSELDKNYAHAMRRLTAKLPNDLDAATLFAEAVMDTMPWRYWTADGRPQEGTEEVIKTLQAVLQQNSQHPGANHYLIHIAEQFRPEIAEEAADRLVNLVPEAGHMQHMPSHIYIRLGRYHDASRVNQMAMEADQIYLKDCPLGDLWEMMYIPHNIDFLVATASLEGRSELAIKSAFEVTSSLD